MSSLADKVSGVEIIPVHSIGGEFPATIPLLFVANVLTEYNTSRIGILVYSWDFGDGHTLAGSPAASTTVTTSHVYSNAGSYTITCTVQGALVTNTGQLAIEVFEGNT